MNTDRMSCGEVRERLPLFVGGDLDPDVLEAVRGHLGLCGECARLIGKVTAARHELVAAFRAQQADVARPGLWPGIRATLQAEGLIHPAGEVTPQPVVPRVNRARWTILRWGLAPLAAAAVLLLLVQVAGEFEGGAGSKVLPNGPRAIPAPAVADVPVSAPIGGTLVPVGADQVDQQLPAPYSRRGDGRAPAAGGASLAGYKNNRIK